MAAIVGVFVISRLIFHMVGIRFDMTSLDWYPQYIDPPLLRDRLLESTYFLHSQPPLFNLFMGAVLKLFPGREAIAFGMAYRALGLVLAVSMFLLMRNMRIRTTIALPLTIAFLLSPPCILFESWLFYAYPLTTFLCVAAIFLHKYLRTERISYAVLFFTFLALVALTRSLFHLAWFALFPCILLVQRKDKWRQVAIACSAPLVAVCFLYVKNLVLFDNFAGSTWLGMSFGKMTTLKLPEDERRALIDQGRISELAMIRPFSSIDTYKEHVPLPEKTGIPVLDQERKTRGHPKYNSNYNNLVFVHISKQYLRDALVVLRLKPGVYLRTVALSFGIYFFPANEYVFFQGNRSHMKSFDAFYNRVLYGQVLPHETRAWKSGHTTRHDLKRLSPIGFFLIIGFLAFLISGWRHMMRAPDHALKGTLLFIYVTVIYVTLVANLVEIGENNRFRFVVDPLILVGVGLCLNDIVNLVRAKLPGKSLTGVPPKGGPG